MRISRIGTGRPQVGHCSGRVPWPSRRKSRGPQSRHVAHPDGDAIVRADSVAIRVLRRIVVDRSQAVSADRPAFEDRWYRGRFLDHAPTSSPPRRPARCEVRVVHRPAEAWSQGFAAGSSTTCVNPSQRSGCRGRVSCRSRNVALSASSRASSSSEAGTTMAHTGCMPKVGRTPVRRSTRYPTSSWPRGAWNTA